MVLAGRGLIERHQQDPDRLLLCEILVRLPRTATAPLKVDGCSACLSVTWRPRTGSVCSPPLWRCAPSGSSAQRSRHITLAEFAAPLEQPDELLAEPEQAALHRLGSLGTPRFTLEQAVTALAELVRRLREALIEANLLTTPAAEVTTQLSGTCHKLPARAVRHTGAEPLDNLGWLALPNRSYRRLPCSLSITLEPRAGSD